MEVAENRVRTIKASEFKVRCLNLMDDLADNGGEVIITKNGRPVSRLLPYREQPKAPVGRDRDKIRIIGDIIEPIDMEWEAVSNPGGVLNE